MQFDIWHERELLDLELLEHDDPFDNIHKRNLLWCCHDDWQQPNLQNRAINECSGRLPEASRLTV